MQDASAMQGRVATAGAVGSALGWGLGLLNFAGRRKMLREALDAHKNEARQVFSSWRQQHRGLLFCMHVVTTNMIVGSNSTVRRVWFCDVTADPVQMVVMAARAGSIDNLSSWETAQSFYFWAVPAGAGDEAMQIVLRGADSIEKLPEGLRPGLQAIEYDPASGPAFN